MHLAQFNVAHMRAPVDDPLLAEFVAALEPVNTQADAAPGFVWRAIANEDDPEETITHEFGDHLLINYSIWESRDALWNFVYRSPHLAILQRRREWFHRVAEPYTVMWWVEEGEIPSLKEAWNRLTLLRQKGPTPDAFTFKEFYEPNGARG
ncbi:DUF3291 domain-containing protein [Herbidospora daliensis]|uniref:DUF3291 domain-containing protein n=1 Tax=Herbidospora daliensis TaxID=295585 RepID=UPI00078468BC|nr:DUF3291 domain-containing protein [Herbidospora daliensis]